MPIQERQGHQRYDMRGYLRRWAFGRGHNGARPCCRQVRIHCQLISHGSQRSTPSYMAARDDVYAG